MVGWLRLALLVATGYSTSALADGCFNVGRGQPRALTGVLDYVIYPGPPGYEDVQKGDTPEPNFVLRLPRSICLTGSDFANPANRFSTVQVIETKAVSGRLKGFLRRSVTLTLDRPFAAETGHHHEPLVAWVTAIAPANRPMDFLDEYGTAATVIRAFYAALGDGQGVAASELIVPEKRRVPAFSPAVLSRFYGGLKEPIRLIGISQSGPNSFIARYRYATQTTRCDGRVSITTTARKGRNFIQGIRALDGC